MAFWAPALDYEPRYDPEPDWVILQPRDGVGPNLSLNLGESRPEAFPHIHLDLYAHEQAAEVERLVGLGARRVAGLALSRRGARLRRPGGPRRQPLLRHRRSPRARNDPDAGATPTPDATRRRTGRLSPVPGPTNTLTDVAGIRVGHATRREVGWLTGTTVVLAPDAGAVAGVDVRGGAPGTRETDLLDPRNLVDRVNAVVLTGGSAFGLAAADGVVQSLYAAGLGWPMGEPGEVVPIVPAAVLFDLGRGGEFGHAPTASDGTDAVAVASADAVVQGCVGAGTGARSGGLKGAVGSASAVLDDGTTVAALVVVNSFGAPYDRQTGELLAGRHGLGDEFAHLGVCRPRTSWRLPANVPPRHTRGSRCAPGWRP